MCIRDRFEDNAEFGFGMSVSVEARRNELKSAVERLNDVLGVPARAWLASFNDAKQSKVTGDILLAECEKIQDTNADAKYVVENQDMLLSLIHI